MAVIEVPLEDGTTILVEIDPHVGGPVKAGRTDPVALATETAEAALQPVISLAKGLVQKIREAEPEDVTVAFGVKFTAESGVVLSRIAGECNLTVTLRWNVTDREA